MQMAGPLRQQQQQQQQQQPQRGHPPQHGRPANAGYYLALSLLGWAVVLSLVATFHPLMHLQAHSSVTAKARAAFAGGVAQHTSHTATEDAASLGCRPLGDLGFKYPPLKAARSALAALHCEPPLGHSSLRARYTTALRLLDPSGGAAAGPGDDADSATAAAAAAKGHLDHFLDNALAHIKQEGEQVLQCRLDPAFHPTATTTTSTTSSFKKRVLFAANLSNSGALLPNLIVQLLRLALLLPPDHLAVSIFESGSNDLTRQWLSLLRMLLIPLGVPHNVTLGGALRPRVGGARVAFMAALRNAAIEPFLTGGGGGGGGSGSGAWRPEVIVFANDVFWCVGDALRLLGHEADLACGLDFYTAAWQASSAATATSSGRSGDGGEAAAEVEDEDDVMLLRQIGVLVEGEETGRTSSSSSSSSSIGTDEQQSRQRRQLQRVDPVAGQQAAAAAADGDDKGVTAAELGSSPSQQVQLRFYDKVRFVYGSIGALRGRATTGLACTPDLTHHPTPTEHPQAPARFLQTLLYTRSGWPATSQARASAT